MAGVDSPKNTIQRVTEIYVAVFPVSVNDDMMTEVILAGYRKDHTMSNMTQIRATVETNADSVKDLVALCDEIVDEQEEIASYRLLKFDKYGIHTLSPDDFRAFEQRNRTVRWGYC